MIRSASALQNRSNGSRGFSQDHAVAGSATSHDTLAANDLALVQNCFNKAMAPRLRVHA